MSVKFKLTTTIPASPEVVYNAWLDSKEHSLMTGSDIAVASHKVGSIHRAHGPYIMGKNLELIPFSKIVQSWRTTDFKTDDPDSIIEILFKPKDSSTFLTLIHTNLPEHQLAVKQGWKDYYFKPMKRYFKSRRDN